MPGTLVTDSNAPTLLNAAALTETGTGSAIEVGYPQNVRARLTLGACTGTSTSMYLKVQGCNTSGFSSGVVDYGEFPVKDQDDDSSTFYLDINVRHRYVRANYTIAGNTPSFTSTLVLEEDNYKRVDTDTA